MSAPGERKVRSIMGNDMTAVSSASGGRRRGWLMVGWLGLVLAAASSLACSAVYPEMSTALKSAPQGRQLEPPPGPELLFIRIQSAEIPKKTRDGRQ